MRFFKYQALGNDYLVLPDEPAAALTPGQMRRVCNRHFGLGSDGILLPAPYEQPGVEASQAPGGDFAGDRAAFGLRIFNPDGSEAEKSGNGLRIYARYLYDQGLVAERPFAIYLAGGPAECAILQGGAQIRVGMGHPSFESVRIPMLGPPRRVVDEAFDLYGQPLQITCLTLGNPHCVVFCAQTSPEIARQLGPQLEQHPAFPRRTNVQFAQVIDKGRLRLEIWERGAGYTLASGSSSCAAAAAAFRLGLCEPPVLVSMPGGELAVDLDASGSLSLTGPASRVAWGELDPGLLLT